MKLYFNPKSRALIARWMLDECGAAYDTVTLNFDTRFALLGANGFLALNPRLEISRL